MGHAVHEPVKTLFLVTSMPVGGAETLLANLVRRLDRSLVQPEICCLKEPGPLGEELAREIPVHSGLITSKYDLRVVWRLIRLMRRRDVQAIVTVGAGDKMFWGRIAAKLAGVPVIASALHSTGWPDSVGRLNRLLTWCNDAFIGVAEAHALHLVEGEGFPAERVHTIFNGVDTDRFRPGDDPTVRQEIGIPPEAHVVAILAALRPEKNHTLFLRGAQRIAQSVPETHFLVIGDGPERDGLTRLADSLGIAERVHFVGSRGDVDSLLRTVDLLALTSDNEASPVSILEALATGVPVVATEVGSVPESVVPGQTGFLFPTGDVDAFHDAAVRILTDPELRESMGKAGRELVQQRASLEAMVEGYENLLVRLYREKTFAAPGQTAPQSYAPNRSATAG